MSNATSLPPTQEPLTIVFGKSDGQNRNCEISISITVSEALRSLDSFFGCSSVAFGGLVAEPSAALVDLALPFEEAFCGGDSTAAVFVLAAARGTCQTRFE